MKRFLLFLLALPLVLVLAPVLAGLPLAAQTTVNLFDWSQGRVVPKTEFLKWGHLAMPDYKADPGISIYKTFTLTSGSSQTYRLKIGGAESQPDSDGIYESFYILDGAGKTILAGRGNDPLCTVRHLVMDQSTKDSFIQIPLGNESFALVFAGLFYDASDSAGEMIVVVVDRDEAKVVYDAPALAYSYTAPPNFSIEFVDDISGVAYEQGRFFVTAAQLASRTKHKIWREGNLLKYKSWK